MTVRGIINTERFPWAPLYEAIADKLIAFKDDRTNLIKAIHELSNKIDGMGNLQDRSKEGGHGYPLQDICPFTVFGLFNRGTTDEKRKTIAQALAKFLGVDAPIPAHFDGIPIVINMGTWFFASKYKRRDNDIDVLWKVFALAIEFADNAETASRDALAQAYDEAMKCHGVGWKMSMGLYWIRPWKYLTLDGKSQTYITEELGLDIGNGGEDGRASAGDYFTLIDELSPKFQEDAYPVHSFPELSLAAWEYEGDKAPAQPNATDSDTVHEPENDEGEAAEYAAQITPYHIDDIIADGCFIDRESLEKIVECIRTKKNLILQGPPGTGKTWLAKRLAFALMGQKDNKKLRAVQFHPNLSYEDFVRGWRPSGDGKLMLVDGPFLEMVNIAKKDAHAKYVVVIEEINRGNPAQIFGEMLTLLEADKRTQAEALELSYRREQDGYNERVFVPDNLYVIGTMNIADRSLALVDLALRRRFAFMDLKPTFGKPWQNWVHDKAGIAVEFLAQIEERLVALNADIENDGSLGAQYQVGHSYVTPATGTVIKDAKKWYKSVVENEIGPLLDEYWFDNLARSRKAQKDLTDGM